MQRRNQKVVERAPAPYLTQEQRDYVCGLGLRIARAADYECAGTVEFLMDADSGEFYFIEVNPRIQVEHTVTEEVTASTSSRADPDRRGRDLAEATGKAAQDDDQAERPRDPVPDHHRGSAEQLHPRLRPDHRLSRRDGGIRSMAAPPIRAQ